MSGPRIVVVVIAVRESVTLIRKYTRQTTGRATNMPKRRHEWAQPLRRSRIGWRERVVCDGEWQMISVNTNTLDVCG